MAPDGGVRADLHDAVALAIPAGHGHALPSCGLVGQDFDQARQSRALGPGAPDSAGPPWRRRLVEGGVEAQTGDAGDLLPEQGGQELESGEATVGHQHQRPVRHPAAGLQDQLPSPVGELLVAQPALAAVALRGSERRQERQSLRWHSTRYAAGTLTSSAQARPAQEIGTSSIRLSQRRPLALTKCPWLERTGSR
jgi:hypothetical protein